MWDLFIWQYSALQDFLVTVKFLMHLAAGEMTSMVRMLSNGTPGRGSMFAF